MGYSPSLDANPEETYLHLLGRAVDIQTRMGWTFRESMTKAFLFISAEKAMYRRWRKDDAEFYGTKTPTVSKRIRSDLDPQRLTMG